jgi:hypothetical protein
MADGDETSKQRNIATIPAPTTYVALVAAPGALPRDRLAPPHVRLLDYYAAIAGGAAVARRAAFDPIDVPFILPNLILWDVPAGPSDDYRCRLAGTEICTYAGRELRGESLARMNGASADMVRAEFDAVRTRGDASYVERTMDWVDRPYRLYRRLLLPYADASGKVSTLMGAILFEPLSL